MKGKYNALAAFILTIAVVFAACEKNIIALPGGTPTGARVKFIQACSNCSTPAVVVNGVTTVPAINVLITANGQTVNPTGMAYGAPYPVNSYAILPTGEVSLDFTLTDAKALFSTKVTLAEGKYYSIYVGDTIPTPTISLVEDDIKSFQDTFLRARFVNVLTGRTKDTLELVRKNDNTVVATGVTYGKASDFKFIPASTADTFFYRKVGTTVIYPLTANSILTSRNNGRTLTFLARGVNNKIGTSVQIPRIDWWANR